MSQLDLSISFSNLMGLLLCFYMFIYFVVFLLIQCWYNMSLSAMDQKNFTKELVSIDNYLLMKKMLML